MKVSLLDLRRKPGRILTALAHNERVTISCRGREVASLVPLERTCEATPVREHAAFGMWAERGGDADVAEQVHALRKGRFDAL